MAGRVVVTSRVSQWVDQTLRGHDRAALAMATEIDRISAQLAPKLTRALVKSKKITRVDDANYIVSYGNTQVPYARRRHWENRKNPQTLKYLERAGDSIKKNAVRYVEREIRT